MPMSTTEKGSRKRLRFAFRNLYVGRLGDRPGLKQSYRREVMEKGQADEKGRFAEATWRRKGTASFVFGEEES